MFAQMGWEAHVRENSQDPLSRQRRQQSQSEPLAHQQPGAHPRPGSPDIWQLRNCVWHIVHCIYKSVINNRRHDEASTNSGNLTNSGNHSTMIFVSLKTESYISLNLKLLIKITNTNKMLLWKINWSNSFSKIFLQPNKMSIISSLKIKFSRI